MTSVSRRSIGRPATDLRGNLPERGLAGLLHDELGEVHVHDLAVDGLAAVRRLGHVRGGLKGELELEEVPVGQVEGDGVHRDDLARLWLRLLRGATGHREVTASAATEQYDRRRDNDDQLLLRLLR